MHWHSMVGRWVGGENVWFGEGGKRCCWAPHTQLKSSAGEEKGEGLGLVEGHGLH